MSNTPESVAKSLHNLGIGTSHPDVLDMIEDGLPQPVRSSEALRTYAALMHLEQQASEQ